MSADIQFGEIEEHGPTPGIRPDEDAAFSVAPVGEIAPDDLPIFVDLDVMRDMEAHALSNTKVELGGVMLGMHHIDSEGRPFVIVSDCLQARHYEATKGSFKFTHDTWSQITSERAEFRPDLEMVGWYHTHPGWSVFLSGMDLFICNNFFNRDLDVALVIDPCEQDRGWFQWTTAQNPNASSKKTRPTRGFLLTTNRYREQELNQFARIYSRKPDMNYDPRYNPGTLSGTSQPVVNIMESSRRPMMDVALLSMLGLQFLFLCLIAWKLLSTPAAVAQNGDDATAAQIEQLDSYVTELRAAKYADLEKEALRNALQEVVSAQGGPADWVEKYSGLEVETRRAIEGIDGQRAIVLQKQRELGETSQLLNQAVNDAKLLDTELAGKKKDMAVLQDKNEILSNKLKMYESGKTPQEIAAADESGEKASGTSLPWWAWGLGGVALTVLGFFGGRLQSRSDMNDYYDDSLGEISTKGRSLEIEDDKNRPTSSDDAERDSDSGDKRRRG